MYIENSLSYGFFQPATSEKSFLTKIQIFAPFSSSIMSSSFGDLLQQAEQLTADMDSGWELPRVERNLHQLAEAGQRLWAQTTSAAGDNAAVKA